ncbi:hypothetical protein BV372_08090 [Nostoc sp. T09]|uniref:hypothetical protein n=1 Tax=Nostoc sp. T09 TaxID=1932621 RepID=UPI000A3623CA|nr:hypothetical protein [Nostoc sp. T09]OUL36367.1 hypothetical protein BV372_08090 [Nostoc sp. T09]
MVDEVALPTSFMEILLGIIIRVLMYALIWVIWMLFQEIKKQKQASSPAQKQPNKPRYTPPKPTVDPKLQLRLLNMVAGDHGICYRLVEIARRSNPGRSEQWYWEKAIEDLIRDRR